MEENNTQLSNEVQSKASLSISKTAINYLSETGKWTKFLSIIGLIFVGLFVLMGLFASSFLSFMSNDQMEHMPGGFGFMFGGIYILMGLLYFFPAFYLLKFSQKLKQALSTNDTNDLNEALSNQKSFYKFWGIFMIILIGLYILMGIIALAAGLF